MAKTDNVDHDPKELGKKSKSQLKEEVRARLRRLDPKTASEVVADTANPVRGTLSGFVTFIRERAVVGLAIGFVFGSQVQGIVNDFIKGFVDPLFQLITGSADGLSNAHFAVRGANFKWGQVVHDLIVFLFITFIIYLVIKLFKLDKLDKKDK